MSILPWLCRKGRKQSLTVRHLLLYTGLLTLGYLLYHWPRPLATLSKGNNAQKGREFGLPCTGNGHGGHDGCAKSQRVTGRDVPPAKITEVTRGVNATVKTVPPLADEFQLEPKNWNGQGYQPVPNSRGPLRHCGQCALVTSSGHLSGKGAGKEIDKSECVIRMNAAPSVGYERDVGSRTTFRVVGHRNFPRMFDTEEERRLYFVNSTTRSEAIVVLWLYSVNVNRNLELILARKFAPKYKDVTFYLTKQEVMNRNVELFYQELGISKNTKRLWMSTGWVAMLFALEVCDEIDVYGMIYEDYCKENPGDKTPYHYFDQVQLECNYYERSEKRIGSGHKFMTEKVAFARWAAAYNIRFHVPSWEGHGYDPNVRKETVFQRAYMQYKERLNKEAGKDTAKEAPAPAVKKIPFKQQKLPDRTKDVVAPERTKSIQAGSPAQANEKADAKIEIDRNRTGVLNKEEKLNDHDRVKSTEAKEKNDQGGLKGAVDGGSKVADEKEGEVLLVNEHKHRELDPDLIEEHVQDVGRR